MEAAEESGSSVRSAVPTVSLSDLPSTSPTFSGDEVTTTIGADLIGKISVFSIDSMATATLGFIEEQNEEAISDGLVRFTGVSLRTVGSRRLLSREGHNLLRRRSLEEEQIVRLIFTISSKAVPEYSGDVTSSLMNSFEIENAAFKTTLQSIEGLETLENVQNFSLMGGVPTATPSFAPSVSSQPTESHAPSQAGSVNDVIIAATAAAAAGAAGKLLIMLIIMHYSSIIVPTKY